jgi:hypothetical protein
MPDTELISFANELRTRAKEILVRATNTVDLEVQEMARVVTAGYEKLARTGRATGSRDRQGLASPRRSPSRGRVCAFAGPA